MNEKNVQGIEGNGEAKKKINLAVYGHNVHYAREHGELDAFNKSYRLNAQCKDAIEETITQNYDVGHLKENIVLPLAERFGVERMGMILAGTIREACWDKRFSEDNRTWAEEFPIPKDIVWRMRDGDLILDIHPDVLEKFTDMFREEGLGKEPEMACRIADRYIQASEEGCDSLLENAGMTNRMDTERAVAKVSGQTEKPSLRAKLEEEKTKTAAPDKSSPKKDRSSRRGEAR